MNVRSIKFKLIALMAVSLLVIAASIVTASLSKASGALVQSNMALLDAVKASKKDHILEFFNTIEVLLTSKSGDIATVETLWALDDTFQELEEIEGVSNTKIKNALLDHYENEYLNKVNYHMKNEKPSSETQE